MREWYLEHYADISLVLGLANLSVGLFLCLAGIGIGAMQIVIGYVLLREAYKVVPKE